MCLKEESGRCVKKKEIMLLEKSRRNVSEKEGEVCKEGQDSIEKKWEVC